jgi:hypothetical protein
VEPIEIVENNFEELLSSAKAGDMIPLYEGEWDTHPKGVLIRKGRKLFLNGKASVYEGEWDNWREHHRGVVIEKDNQLLLNGKTLLYGGEYDEWLSHPDGVVIRKGNQLFLSVYKE